ncbi:hypothetical protein JOB18_013813 [Solea senegalensis]|uniref:Uncharacterized protein n=1 Tax=Solea senegalensis TaxID=28829 RepID=A0AAV6Q9X2_SOLSE|nr:hypothetical protein JOB18_013813 [Solea senegalensis]
MDDDAAAPSPISSAAVNVVKALEDEEERERWMLTWSCGRGWCYNGYKQQQQQSLTDEDDDDGDDAQSVQRVCCHHRGRECPVPQKFFFSLEDDQFVPEECE